MTTTQPVFVEAPSVPHSREAEEAVIGAVMINPDVHNELHFLKPNDFYVHRNGWIWEAFINLQERHVPIDMLTLSEELERSGRLIELGGPAYIVGLVNQVPSSLNAAHYGKIVQAAHIRRKMINAANTIAGLAYNPEKEILEIEAEASDALIKANGYNEHEGEMIAESILRVYKDAGENAERRKKGEPLQLGIPTGYKDLDMLLQGMKQSKFIIIAGRPGMGKTSLKLCLLRSAALDHKKKTAIFSLEMTSDEIATSLLSQYSKIDSQRIESGALSGEEWPVFTNATDVLSDSNIYIDDTPGLTPASLRAKCLARKQRHGLDLVIVDYIQLMNAGIKTNIREQEVSYISRNLKLLARELKVPVVCGCQMSRAIENRSEKRPVLSDLRESGALEQDADIVIFLHRPDQYEKDSAKQNVTELNIAKNRKGPTGSVELIFRTSIVRFENAEKQYVGFGKEG